MVYFKIKDTRSYPSYYKTGLVLFPGQTGRMAEEDITQDIADDVKNGVLEVVSGNVPTNLLYDKQEGF